MSYCLNPNCIEPENSPQSNFCRSCLNYLWTNQSSVILIAAILSGLWMPILYYPLHFWWQKIFAASKFG